MLNKKNMANNDKNYLRKYQVCTKCIMGTTDPEITFDEEGICSHCHQYKQMISNRKYLSKKEPYALEKLIKRIKRGGMRKKYNCIIGVSGGVDSTYTAYKVKKLGFTPLAVHLDNGWNSEIAVNNMKEALKKLDIDFHTIIADLAEFKDLQLSFLKASTPDIEIPTDHAILSALYGTAVKYKVKYIFIGRNIATEGGGVSAWSQGHGDWRYIKSIQKKFGTKKLKKFPHYGLLEFLYYALIKRIKCISILDYFDYNKEQARAILKKELGWKDYGGKHYESIYTRFVQGYILPKKFGFDKKRLHLSSLIWSGQISRAEAIREMEKNDYPEELQKQDKEFVIKKLGISEEEFEQIMNSPCKNFYDYPSYKKSFYRYKWLISIYHYLKR